MTRREFLVSEVEAGCRLDRVIAGRLPELSRAGVRRAFEERRVWVDGKPAVKGAVARVGEHIVIRAPTPAAKPLPLRIVYETNDVVVVDKPPGEPSVSRPATAEPSVATALLERFPQMMGIGYGERDGGLLSRLDTQTSGLLLSAKNRTSFETLRSGAASGQLAKGYLALVASPCGLSPGIIELPLGPRKGNRRKVATGTAIRGNPVPSRTEIVAVYPKHHATLIEARVFTAYRHQIRAHLAFSGCPILGDRLYGGAESTGLERHALHAHRLAWLGTETLTGFDVECPLAPDLARFWAP